MRVLISKSLIDSNITHAEFVLTNSVLKSIWWYERRNQKDLIVHQKWYSIYKTILLYCLKRRKNAESKNPKVVKTKNRRIMFLWKCLACDIKRSRFIKEQKASGLLRSLEIKTSLSKILLVGSRWIIT